jgi:hypothetical protein
MNLINALTFSAIGSLMEILPRVFPSWFPPTHADHASCQALWLDLMGAVQVALGVGYMLRAHVAPVVVRILSPGRDGEPGALALPSPRGVTGR